MPNLAKFCISGGSLMVRDVTASVARPSHARNLQGTFMRKNLHDEVAVGCLPLRHPAARRRPMAAFAGGLGVQFSLALSHLCGLILARLGTLPRVLPSSHADGPPASVVGGSVACHAFFGLFLISVWGAIWAGPGLHACGLPCFPSRLGFPLGTSGPTCLVLGLCRFLPGFIAQSGPSPSRAPTCVGVCVLW